LGQLNEEITWGKTRRSYTLITVLSITLLALVMLVSIVCATPFAYITNYGSNNISVIDTANDTVIATVPVGIGPLELQSVRMEQKFM